MGERILIIEDDIDQSGPFSEMLRYRGYDVRCTDSIGSAIAAVPLFRPDLLIVDLLMVTGGSDADGFDLINSIRSEGTFGSKVGILVWTAHYVSTRDEIRALRAGADDYVRKELEYGLLEARIEALLRRLRRTADSN